MNTDGVKVFKSTDGGGLWPVFLQQDYLRPEKRFNVDNMILVALYYGKNKPNMNEFLAPLVEEFQHYDKFKLKIVIECKPILFQPIILTCCVDLPAKSAVQKIIQYNGRFSCGFCLHGGQSVQINKGKQIRYGIISPDPVKRTHESTKARMSTIRKPSKKKSAAIWNRREISFNRPTQFRHS